MCMGRPKNFDRTEVLEKAMPLFWKRGFADTGLQDLEQATGVNKSGLYSEFKNKEDLFLEALKHYSATRKGRDLLSVEPLGWGNLDAFLKYKLARKDGLSGCFAVNTMRESELLPHEAQEIIAESRGNLKQLFLKNIAAGKAEDARRKNHEGKDGKEGRDTRAGLSPEALTEIFSTWFSGLCIEQNMKSSKASAKAASQGAEEFLTAFRAM